MNLTEKDVREILRLLDESGYDELKLQTDSFNLTLRQSGEQPSQQPGEQSAAEKTVEAAPASDQVASKTSAAPARSTADGEFRDIYPPLPGTFYRAPSPGAEPFVDVGSEVREDTVVALVETMKLMNSVMAGCNGKVVEICQENGALIEAGDVLLRIRETRDNA